MTLGTTPPTRVVGVPAGGALTFDFDQTAFATASSVAATTTPTGSTAPGTAGVIGLSYV